MRMEDAKRAHEHMCAHADGETPGERKAGGQDQARGREPGACARRSRRHDDPVLLSLSLSLSLSHTHTHTFGVLQGGRQATKPWTSLSLSLSLSRV
jgi:hypothetical protein